MKSEHFLKEGFVEDASEVHADHEVQMARSDLFHAAEDALVLHKLLRNVSEQQGLEGWVAAKITLASDYLKTVREYIEYELMTAASEQPMLPIAEGSTNDYFKRRKDEEDRIAGTKAPAKRTPQQTDYAKRRAQEKKTEQGVAEGEYKSRHIHRQEQNKKYDEYRRNQEAQGKKPLSRGDWAATQRKGQQGVAKGLVERGSGYQPSTEPDTPEQAARRQQSLQAHQAQQQAPKPPIPDEEYQRRLQQYKTGGRGAGWGFQPKPEDAAAAEAERAKLFGPKTTQQPGTKFDEQSVSEGSSCNMTMEGKSCPMHGLKECPGYKSNIKETTAGSVAGVVNPTPKNKAKVGTLFGGTYKQKKSK